MNNKKLEIPLWKSSNFEIWLTEISKWSDYKLCDFIVKTIPIDGVEDFNKHNHVPSFDIAQKSLNNGGELTWKQRACVKHALYQSGYADFLAPIEPKIKELENQVDLLEINSRDWGDL